ncbi:MAG TPA: colanic acid biosynthesis glycosyltransferase WcaL, partial [Candidatus Pacearchaeota archaeon]|nr:colanic acid biosynthesis glycosyltransferase WcaL [Candidatus Pacearchaeota archaeon]
VILKNIGAIEGKVITTFHGADMSRYIERKGNKVYNYLLENGDLFLPISERWKNELINLGCNEQKIIVHRMGVDTNKFVFTHRNLTANKKIHLLTVARLVEKKGVQYGIQAVAKAVRKYPDIEYRIVGNGPLKSEMKLLIDKLKIEDKVKLIGRKRQEDVIELMKDADILLAPSVTDNNGDQEGIPVVLMEALAQGLPVISTYHSGIPELIQDGESGYLVPERDIDALAEKLTYLIEHPDRWIKMGQEGRKYVEEYYNINKLNDRLIEIYRYLLDEDNK